MSALLELYRTLGGVPRSVELWQGVRATTHTPSYEQQSFQFFNDDGSHTANTQIANQDVPIVRQKGANRVVILRVRINQTVSNANTDLTLNFKVRYSTGGAYADIGAQGASAPVRYFNSSNLTHQDTISSGDNRIGGSLGGRVDEQGNSGSVTFSGSSSTEIVFAIEIVDSLVSASDQIDLRVYRTDNTAMNSYGITPSITITAAPSLPGTPTVSATAISDSEIDLAIGAGSDATGHRVHRVEGTSDFTPTGTTAGTGNCIADDLGPSPTEYNDTDLEADTAYSYKVVAVNLEGETASDHDSATTLSAEPEPDPVERSLVSGFEFIAPVEGELSLALESTVALESELSSVVEVVATLEGESTSILESTAAATRSTVSRYEVFSEEVGPTPVESLVAAPTEALQSGHAGGQPHIESTGTLSASIDMSFEATALCTQQTASSYEGLIVAGITSILIAENTETVSRSANTRYEGLGVPPTPVDSALMVGWEFLSVAEGSDVALLEYNETTERATVARYEIESAVVTTPVEAQTAVEVEALAGSHAGAIAHYESDVFVAPPAAVEATADSAYEATATGAMPWITRFEFLEKVEKAAGVLTEFTKAVAATNATFLEFTEAVEAVRQVRFEHEGLPVTAVENSVESSLEVLAGGHAGATSHYEVFAEAIIDWLEAFAGGVFEVLVSGDITQDIQIESLMPSYMLQDTRYELVEGISSTPVEAEVQSGFEALKGITAQRTVRYEAEGEPVSQISATAVVQVEVLRGGFAGADLHYEAEGTVPLVEASHDSLFEILAGFGITSTDRFESLAVVGASQVVNYEFDVAPAGVIAVGRVESTAEAHAPHLVKNIVPNFVASTVEVYEVEFGEGIIIPLVTSTATVYAPAVAKILEIPHVSSTAAAADPEVGSIVEVDIIDSTADVAIPAFGWVVRPGLVTSTAEAFEPRFGSAIELPLVASTTEASAPAFVVKIDVPFVGSAAEVFTPSYLNVIEVAQVASTAAVLSPEVITADYVTVDFISSGVQVFELLLDHGFGPSFIPSTTEVHTPALLERQAVDTPLVGSVVNVYAPTLTEGGVLSLALVSSTVVIYHPILGPLYVPNPYGGRASVDPSQTRIILDTSQTKTVLDG